jgi:DNA-binding CsgD family transcriptional regulator
VLTAARRFVIASGALAVVMTVPVDDDDVSSLSAGVDDPFAAALVAGTIDAHGAVSSLSTAVSPMETELVSALDVSLRHAAHPADGTIVDQMLQTLAGSGSASGEVRLPHSELGWVPCQFQLFAMRRAGRSGSDSSLVELDQLVFVLTASIGTRLVMERIARLERHIRRIGSEVHAADVALTVADRTDRGSNTLLDGLDLTVRQREIVERLLLGQRVATIGAALYISQSTVRNHLARVYRLVGVHSQEALLDAVRAA